MIISASRRTDIPAFYARWFINRIRSGSCTTPNPLNPKQVSVVSLAPEDVDVIVFWTRSPRPLFPYLQELDERGYRYIFQFTLLNNPRLIDPYSPEIARSLDTFRWLADRIGPDRLVWRYDPIVLSEITSPDFHRENYTHLCQELHGYVHRSVISFLDIYAGARKRLAEIEHKGARLVDFHDANLPPSSSVPQTIGKLTAELAKIASDHQIEIQSCAEVIDLGVFGVRAGKCIDDEHMLKVFGLDVSHTKDPGQRTACGCVKSKDIGMYDSCLFGCRYCYATRSFERAWENYRRHNPEAPSLYELHPHPKSSEEKG